MFGMNNHRKFKNYLIDPKFQFKYVLWVTTTGLALILFNAGVFYFFTKESYRVLVEITHVDGAVKSQLYQQLHDIVIYLGSFSLIFLILTGILGIIMSHRTAGPMYRFKQAFKQVQGGDLQARIRLRPKDDFQDVMHEWNKMMDILMNRINPRL